MSSDRGVFFDQYGLLRFGWMLLLVFGGVAIFIASVVLTVNAIAFSQDRAACTGFATNTGRVTKFVSYTYWQWDCLTPSTDGHWISIDNLREVNK